jgi:hypothetical protein
MTAAIFKNSLQDKEPPQNSSVYLSALWYEAKGDWDKAHELIQDITDKDAAWVHAYLHRKEGDIGNADYWYRRAGKQRPTATLEEEWTMLVDALG